MSGTKSDASTSTEDIKGRPLCVFYFTHPFAVLSPEPPTVLFGPPGPAPPTQHPYSDNNMRQARVRRACPVSPPTGPLYTVGCPWPCTSAAGKVASRNRTLPPLQLPTHRDLYPLDSSDGVWSIKCANPEKFSLPPIEMPTIKISSTKDDKNSDTSGRRSHDSLRDSNRSRRQVRACGRRCGAGGVRKEAARAALARLLRRAVAVTGSAGGTCNNSLQAALATVRAAWATPNVLRASSSTTSISSIYNGYLKLSAVDSAADIKPADGAPPDSASFIEHTCTGVEYHTEEALECGIGGGAEVSTRAGSGRDTMRRPPSSPGLPRRRYSVPETVMRRYNLSRMRLETEEGDTGLATTPSIAPASPTRTPCCAVAASRHPRELMRRSALLRRLWGRQPAISSCDICESRECRSLDSSHSELRPPWSSLSATPDRSRFIPDPQLPRVDNIPTERIRGTPHELLEIVVSASSPPITRAPASHRESVAAKRRLGPAVDIDRYVSDVLVESLNSLTGLLENMNASIGDGQISIVEKEIKVRLRNTGVNTIVHLSPTSNNQIIFGNEELYERETRPVAEPPLSPKAVFETAPPAALQRIQRLFNDEAISCEPEEPPLMHDDVCADEGGGSAVDSWRAIDSRSAEGSARWDGTGGGSPSTSLVDSLDDPDSPRPQFIRKAPVPLQPPLPPPSHREKSEAFFIRIKDDNCECEKDVAGVADRMPDKIKRRLYRRHRRRELRMESARRARSRTQRHVAPEMRAECAAVVESLVDEALVGAACRRPGYTNDSLMSQSTLEISSNSEQLGASGTDLPRAERQKRRVPVIFAAQRQPQLPVQSHGTDRAPRRLYHKSEIHDGGKCIEILEIVEYASGSHGSSETASDENAATSRSRRSRIPVPVPVRRPRRPGLSLPAPSIAPTVTSAAPSAANPEIPSVTASTASPSVPPVSSPVILPPEPRTRSDSLRFERVFEAIPEERSSLSVESPGEEAQPSPAPSLRRHSAASGSWPSAPRAPPPGGSRERGSEGKSGQEACRSVTTQCELGAVSTSNSSSIKCSTEPVQRRALQPGGPSLAFREALERRMRVISPVKREEGTARLMGGGDGDGSSCDSESGGGLLCALAPRCLAGAPPLRRRTRRVRRAKAHTAQAVPPVDRADASTSAATDEGGWSLTVAGSCRAALPARLHMRLHFPSAHSSQSSHRTTGDAEVRSGQDTRSQDSECSCTRCWRRASHPSHSTHRSTAEHAPGSSQATSRASLTTQAALPALTETTVRRPAFTRAVSCVSTCPVPRPRRMRKRQKAAVGESRPLVDCPRCRPRQSLPRSPPRPSRTGVSPHDGFHVVCGTTARRSHVDRTHAHTPLPLPIMGDDGLAVLGSAIIPERKPRVISMSERDPTRRCRCGPR